MPNPLRNPMPMPQGPGPSNPQQLGGPANFMQQMIFNKLYQSNPQFRAFADSMRGQNPQQAFQERGLDYNQFQNMDINQVRRMLGM